MAGWSAACRDAPAVMRRLFLWAARNTWLRDRLSTLPAMRRAVRRFMPGETMTAAFDASIRYQDAGIGMLYTNLGESLTSIDEADAVADHYVALLDGIRARGYDAEVSVKPTQLGLDHDEERTFQHLRRLADHAAVCDSFLWIDMEGSAHTESTIRLYERLRALQPRTGICLQAYLKRTASDLERLLPLDPAIRLVKGAYDESATIAYRDKRLVDANFAALAARFLFAGRGRPIRLGLGTHDIDLIDQIADQARAAGLGTAAFEIEMLFGIRTRDQFRLARAGYRVMTLISYGASWYPWYLRRLAERPANVIFALRALLP
jgi:proline dehydrogenase